MDARAALGRVALLAFLGAAACWGVAVAATPAAPPLPQGEPGPPMPSVGIQKMLDDASSLLKSHEPGKAIEAALSAIDGARRQGDRAGEAAAHSLRAKALQELNRRDEAIGEWRAAEAAAGLAGDTPARIQALASAALLLARAGKGDEAKEAIGRAVALGKTESRRPLAAAGALHATGMLFYNNERDTEATEVLEAAIEIREARSPGSLELAESLDQLSQSSMEMGDLSRAETLLKRTLEIREQLTPDSTAVAKTLRGLGELAIRRDDLATAKAFLERSRNILERTASGSSLLAAVYNRLGIVASIHHDEDVAESYFKQALAIYEKDSARTAAAANVLMNLGVTMRRRSDFASARDYYERSLAIIQDIEPNGMTAAKLLNNLGFVMADFGDYEAAEQYARRAQRIFETIAPDPTTVENEHRLLGKIAWSRERYGDARSEYQKELAIVEKLRPAGGTEVSLRAILGVLAALQGDNREADVQFLRALAIAESLAPDSTTPLEEVLMMRAEMSARRGDLASAKTDLLRWKSLREARRAESGFFITDLQTLSTLGALLATTGDRAAGLEILEGVQKTELDYVRLALSSLSEREALGFVANVGVGTNTLVALASGQLAGDLVARARAHDAVIRWRSSVLAEMASRRRIVSERGDPELAGLADEVVKARRALARSAFDGKTPVYGEDPAAGVSEATMARDRAERALAAKSRRFRKEEACFRPGLDAVATALPRGSALVSYVLYREDPYAAASPMPPPSYAAFVLSAGAQVPEVVALGPAAPIDALVAGLRERVAMEASAAGRAPKRSEAAYRDAGTQLRQKIWDPLKPRLSGARRVFVVPDGALNLVDLGTLPVGSGSYVIEHGPAIDYLSAERDLVPGEDEGTGAGLLVLGAPAFDALDLIAQAPLQPAADGAAGPSASRTPTYRGPQPACKDFRSLRFDALPASAQESHAVAALWKETAAAPGPITLLEGASASEARFKREAPGKQVLHLATHGFFLGEGCAPVDARGAPLPKVFGENPLLLSGLSLAGANRRDSAGPDDEDGILTAEEIATLDLTGVEWVVLSACDTGLGQLKTGEGLFGLRRAFQVAGARAVVVSLWQVEDGTARRWMTRLYHERLIQQRTVTEAARRASLDLLRERRAKGASTHPFYWAGFVATGNGR